MFYEQVSSLCAKKGISLSKLISDLDMSTSNGDSWKKGSIPRNSTLKKIADYFDVTIESLLATVVNKEDLEKEEPRGEYIYLDPKDRGRGVPPEILKQITDFFSK